MAISIHPKQYQDVKANLAWYTSITLTIIGILLYLFILPDKHRQVLTTLFGSLPSYNIIGVGVIFVFSNLVGWLLIFGFEFHDKIYDRYFTRWRFNYDLYFILPALVRPFTNKLNIQFFSFAKNNKYKFMNPFYHFVADYEHKHKIRENLIVRFYEAVTNYWITQINEILCFFLLWISFIYYFVYTKLNLPLNTIINMNFIIIFLFLINRWLVRISKQKVKIATSDEIEDIHDRFMSELEVELKNLHNKFDLKYAETEEVKIKTKNKEIDKE